MTKKNIILLTTFLVLSIQIVSACTDGTERCAGPGNLVAQTCINGDWVNTYPEPLNIGICGCECLEIGEQTCQNGHKYLCTENLKLQDLGASSDCENGDTPTPSETSWVEITAIIIAVVIVIGLIFVLIKFKKKKRKKK